MTKEKYVKICPKCGSTDVQVDFSNASFAIGSPVSHNCNSCGTVGMVFPEVEESKVEEFRKKLKGGK